MQVQSCPVRFWQGSPLRHLLVQEQGQATCTTLEDIANWVASMLEADVAPDSAVSLDPAIVDVAATASGDDARASETFRTIARLPVRASMAQVPARHTPKAAAPLAAALKHAASWKDVVKKGTWLEALSWRERTFAGRRFLLWVEDASSQECATIHACDEASGAVGSLRLPDCVLRIAFEHFVDASVGGLAGILGVGRHQHRARPSGVEPLVREFLEGLLDAVYFEANALHDEFEIKLPGLGTPSQTEELGVGFGPDIELASAPGVASTPLQDLAPRSPRSGAGRTPSANVPSPLRRRRLQRHRHSTGNVETSLHSELALGPHRQQPLASRLGIDMDIDAPPALAKGSLLVSEDTRRFGRDELRADICKPEVRVAEERTSIQRRPLWRPTACSGGEGGCESDENDIEAGCERVVTWHFAKSARPGSLREVSGEKKPVLRREMPSLRIRSQNSCVAAKLTQA